MRLKINSQAVAPGKEVDRGDIFFENEAACTTYHRIASNKYDKRQLVMKN